LSLPLGGAARWGTGRCGAVPHLPLDQEIVNGADTSTSYGVVVFLSNCTT
jgi:hypothetical protein